MRIDHHKEIMRFKSCDIGFDSELIRDLNLSIKEGDFVSIIGPTGIGKSTMLRLIGHVDRENRRPKVLKGTWENIEELTTGIVFQSMEQLLPWKTAIENVLLPSLTSRIFSLRHNSKQEVLNHAKDLLEMVGLSNDMYKYPADLSGGMRQRVAIARAMLLEPELLLMDEPFGSLDAFTRSKLQDMLINLFAQSKVTVLFVTHDISEAIKLSNKILTISPSGLCQVFDDVQLFNKDVLEKRVLDLLKN